MKTYKIQIAGYINGRPRTRDSLITIGKEEELYQLEYEFVCTSPGNILEQHEAKKIFKELNINLTDYKYTAELYVDNYTHIVIVASKYKHLEEIAQFSKSRPLRFKDLIKIARKHKMIVADIENDVDSYIYTTYVADRPAFYMGINEVSLYPFKGNMELDGKHYDVSFTFSLEKSNKEEKTSYIRCERNHKQTSNLLMMERDAALLIPTKDGKGNETNFVLAHKDVEKLINIVQEIGSKLDTLEKALSFAVKMGCYIAPFDYDFIWQGEVCQKEMFRFTAKYKKK